MHPFPHTDHAAATAEASGPVAVTRASFHVLKPRRHPNSTVPVESGLPRLFCAPRLADCFILTFRAVSRAARLKWIRLDCRLEGVLERVARTSRFTRFTTCAELVVPTGTDAEAARKLLEQAEHRCLIANSLQGARSLEAQVIVQPTE